MSEIVYADDLISNSKTPKKKSKISMNSIEKEALIFGVFNGGLLGICYAEFYNKSVLKSALIGLIIGASIIKITV